MHALWSSPRLHKAVSTEDRAKERWMAWVLRLPSFQFRILHGSISNSSSEITYVVTQTHLLGHGLCVGRGEREEEGECTQPSKPWNDFMLFYSFII